MTRSPQYEDLNEIMIEGVVKTDVCTVSHNSNAILYESFVVEVHTMSDDSSGEGKVKPYSHIVRLYGGDGRLSQSLHKGDRVYVLGSLMVDSLLDRSEIYISVRKMSVICVAPLDDPFTKSNSKTEGHGKTGGQYDALFADEDETERRLN